MQNFKNISIKLQEGLRYQQAAGNRQESMVKTNVKHK